MSSLLVEASIVAKPKSKSRAFNKDKAKAALAETAKQIKKRRDAAKALEDAAKRLKGDSRKGEHPLKARSAASKIKTTSRPTGYQGRIKVVSKPRKRRKVGPI